MMESESEGLNEGKHTQKTEPFAEERESGFPKANFILIKWLEYRTRRIVFLSLILWNVSKTNPNAASKSAYDVKMFQWHETWTLND